MGGNCFSMDLSQSRPSKPKLSELMQSSLALNDAPDSLNISDGRIKDPKDIRSKYKIDSKVIGEFDVPI